MQAGGPRSIRAEPQTFTVGRSTRTSSSWCSRSSKPSTSTHGRLASALVDTCALPWELHSVSAPYAYQPWAYRRYVYRVARQAFASSSCPPASCQLSSSSRTSRAASVCTRALLPVASLTWCSVPFSPSPKCAAARSRSSSVWASQCSLLCRNQARYGRPARGLHGRACMVAPLGVPPRGLSLCSARGACCSPPIWPTSWMGCSDT